MLGSTLLSNLRAYAIGKESQGCGGCVEEEDGGEDCPDPMMLLVQHFYILEKWAGDCISLSTLGWDSGLDTLSCTHLSP